MGPTGRIYSGATSSGVSLTVLANVTYYEDFDNDGYGNTAETTSSCTGAPDGFVTNHDDCDDDQSECTSGSNRDLL